MSERRPDIGVAVVVMHEGTVLLTQREDFHNWCLPGGGVDPNESIVTAGVREVREETGIDVQIVGQVGIWSRPFWTSGGAYTVILAATPLTYAFAPEPTEVIAVDYFALDALPQPLMIHHELFVRMAFARSWGHMWTSDIRTPAEFMDRGALYRWRDVSGLTRVEAFEQLLVRLGTFTLTDDLDGTIVETYPA